MNATQPPTISGAQDLPPMIDLITAARYLGIGRTTAYALAAKNALPVPVVRIGTALRVPTVPLLKILRIDC
ncbi:helix-turn-helix domain-containing protein [Actinospica robiniae]|uniref:helix-turn-helix domain-containing protein n=1 Tax=Actinospica robiniae TaxID=304901 RepID=UPI0005506D5F|nr:helix-turn-helix domain-containing protein [Actinospica robiniae]